MTGRKRDGPAVGDAAALEVQDVLAEAPPELQDDPRLPDASLADHADDLAPPLADPLQRLPEMRQLSLPSHERRQLGRDVHAGASLAKARDLVGHDGRLLALDRQGWQGPEGERLRRPVGASPR